MVTKKDLEEIIKLLDDYKTEQRKVNNILATELDKINERLDAAEAEVVEVVKQKTEEDYKREARKQNMHKYLNAIVCGPSAFKAKEMVDYAEN